MRLAKIARKALVKLPTAKWIAQDQVDEQGKSYWFAYDCMPIHGKNRFFRYVWVPPKNSSYVIICTDKAPEDSSNQLYQISEVLKQARQKTISNIANSMFLLCWLPIIIAGLLHEYLPHGSAKFLYIASALFLITGAVLSVASKNNEPKNNTNE